MKIGDTVKVKATACSRGRRGEEGKVTRLRPGHPILGNCVTVQFKDGAGMLPVYAVEVIDGQQ